MAANWPLIGRAEELAFVLDQIARPDASAVMVAGAPGVGKTRLANEAKIRAEAMGFTTVRAAASRAAASIPFGALAPLLPRSESVTEGRLDLLRRAVEWMGERAAPPDGGDEADRRLVLFVDDAHLLDDGSAALLLQIAGERWCRLVLTVRSGEPTPDSVTALWKDGAAERLELQVLSAGEGQAFIEAVLAAHGDGGAPRPVEGASLRRIWEAAQGNPLYLREVVLGAVEAGAFVLEGGLWHLTGRMPAPPRLVELVTSRLEGIADPTRRLLEHLAVADVLGLALLETVSEAVAIDDAERRGLIEVTADAHRQQVRLAHPLYGEVLRAQLPVLAARRVRQALADTVTAAGARRREDVLRVATWRLDAGAPTGHELLLEAARQAQRMFDAALAERLASAARRAGGGVAAGVVLAETYFELGRHEEAETLLAGLADEAADDEERARVANARAHNLSNYLDRQDEAAAVVGAAMVTITDPPLLEMLSSRLAVLQLFNGRPAAALAAAEPLLLSSTEGATALRASYVAGIALAELGQHERAREVAAAGHQAHLDRPSTSPQPPEVQHIGRVMAAIEAGWLAEASELATSSYATMVERGQREGQATFAMFEGLVAVAKGDLASADRAFREGAAVNRELHDDLALRWCVAGTGMAAGMAGDAAAAAEASAELDALPPPAAQLMAIALLGRSHAWMSVARGEVTAARALLMGLAGEAVEHDQRAVAIACLHDAARLGERGAAPRLRQLAALVDGPLAPARALHAEALVAGDASAAEQAAVAFEDMGALLLAAEAFTAAAHLYRSDGLARATAAAERRAGALLARCPSAHTPGGSPISGGSVDGTRTGDCRPRGVRP